VALVENLGDRINTAGDEFAPFMTASQTDRLYFSAAREGSTGGRRNNEGYEDTLTGRWSSDMYVSRQAPSGWEAGEAVNSLLNTPRHEVALDFSSQGQVLYFFRGFTLYSGEIFADTTGRKDEYALQPPLFASSMQPEEGDQAPYFFDDTTLVFASRRAGGQGGLDLYITNFRGGAWTTPQNLGPAVNSPYDETTPFLSVDGRTLYFSSNRVEGLGGLDVFRAVFQDSVQAWTPPQNLGTPVNSPGEDAFFRLAPDGRTAYFSSNRMESLGWRDLYIAYFKDQQAEQAGVSRPLLFTSVGKPDPATLADGANGIPSEAAGPRLRPLFYDNDRDVTARDNLRQIDDVAALARSYPDALVVVTVHTDETGPAKFDLYYGIKRAEAIGKALTDRGLAASRIVLRSAGPAYPLVSKTAVDSTGIDLQRLNRRIEVELVSPSGTLPENIRLSLPAPPPGQEAAAAAQYRQLNQGLYFGVEAATTRQILTNDALYRFNDVQIESQPGAGSYRYTVGMVKKYEQAAQLRRDLERQGFREARVAAFIDGRPVSRAEAVSLLRQYPELMVYIRG
jgi:outer membrane protein OmpA-like peptidoglycan-associated protein